MELTRSQFESEAQRCRTELESIKTEVVRAEREDAKVSRELENLQRFNAAQKQSGIQDELDRLETELRAAEIARKNA